MTLEYFYVVDRLSLNGKKRFSDDVVQRPDFMFEEIGPVSDIICSVSLNLSHSCLIAFGSFHNMVFHIGRKK